MGIILERKMTMFIQKIAIYRCFNIASSYVEEKFLPLVFPNSMSSSIPNLSSYEIKQFHVDPSGFILNISKIVCTR